MLTYLFLSLFMNKYVFIYILFILYDFRILDLCTIIMHYKINVGSYIQCKSNSDFIKGNILLKINEINTIVLVQYIW